MYKEKLELLSNYAFKKKVFLDNGVDRYLLSSAMAGIYVSITMLFVATLTSIIQLQFPNPEIPIHRIFYGLTFGISLSMIVMAGAELFTGNNMAMVIGSLTKKTNNVDLAKIWVFSYVGNFVGAVIITILFVATELGDGYVGSFLIETAIAKASYSPMVLFLRGFFCNLFVCICMLCVINMKEETAKLIIIFALMAAFVSSGYEHSIANFSIFTSAILLSDGAFTIPMAVYNLIFVTLGNIVGGGIYGAIYYYLGREKKA